MRGYKQFHSFLIKKNYPKKLLKENKIDHIENIAIVQIKKVYTSFMKTKTNNFFKKSYLEYYLRENKQTNA